MDHGDNSGGSGLHDWLVIYLIHLSVEQNVSFGVKHLPIASVYLSLRG